MPDTLPEMTPKRPLGGDGSQSESYGGVTLIENTGLALATFAARHGKESAAQGALAEWIGSDLAGPGRMTTGNTGCFWIAPDQWMVWAPHDEHEFLADELVDLSGGSASVTEQNDAWCCFDLRGPGLFSVFELLCPMNVRGATGGEAQRTTIHHLACFVLVRTPENIWVLGPRSAAGSLHHALLTATRAAL